MTERKEHWEGVYCAAPPTEVSWYESDPATSLRLIAATDLGRSAPIIDVGGGASRLVDRLLAQGFIDLTVLDLSRHAIDDVRARLGQHSEAVTFVEGDALTWRPARRFELWHDRAVFHFFTDAEDRDRYVEVARGAIGPGGFMVLATFAPDGPEQCSGLAVARYSAQDLAGVFSPHFELVTEQREEHVTPAGVVQPLTWVVLRRD